MKKYCLKRTAWNITLASAITLVAYIALYAIWGAILNSIENPTLKLYMVALMTTAAFGVVLLYISKIRTALGEDELSADYENSNYTSVANDFKLIIKREASTLICMTVIVLLCFAVNELDVIIFGKKTLSLPTIIFAPMCLFDSAIKIPFVGYAVNVALDGVLFILFLLIYRKKKYNSWRKNG